MRRTLAALMALLVALAGTGCGRDARPSTLTVLAASSLRVALQKIADRYEAAHAEVTVRLSVAGSADLAAQLRAGAPADVLATADEQTMASLAPLVESPRVVALNHLVLAVAPGNPKHVRGLASLDGASLVMCAPQVPCGRAAHRLAALAHVRLQPVSEETAVAHVLAKVTSGEADAGLVYATDAQAAGDAVTVVTVPQSAQVVNRSTIGAVAASDQPLAADFVGYVTGPDGRAVLRRLGFAVP